jgi:hypothetical protein
VYFSTIKKNKKKARYVVHACNLSYAGGRNKKVVVLGWPQERPYLKNAKAKRLRFKA